MFQEIMTYMLRRITVGGRRLVCLLSRLNGWVDQELCRAQDLSPGGEISKVQDF